MHAQQATGGYHSHGGVATSKKVSNQNGDGSYTITLETFAEGTSETSTTHPPKDVVLVLDVSGSMESPKGDFTTVPNGTDISYNTIVNSTDRSFFYNTSGNYYDKIYPERTTSSSTSYYRLYTINGDSKYYIGGNYNYTDDPDATIFTVSRNDKVRIAKESRMDALKTAVKAFIDQVAADAADHGIVNQLGIITFAGNNNASSAKVIQQLSDIEGNAESLKTKVDAFISGGGTPAGQGMAKANTEFEERSRENAVKLLIMFTDGEPTDDRAAIGNSTGNQGQGTNAYWAKHHDVLVYSVGLFDNSPDVPPANYQYNNSYEVWRYMNFVSSNFPNATVTSNGTMSPGTGYDRDKGYYKDASGDADLTKIFEAIYDDIGRQGVEVNATSQVKDVMSSSFKLPVDFSDMTDAEKAAWVSQNVTIYTMDLSENGNQWINRQNNPSGVSASIGTNTTDGNDMLNVTGFDFTKDDTVVGDCTGNWVGPRTIKVDGQTTIKYAGKKLVVEFNIVAVEDGTGGESANTNTSDSGVYIQKKTPQGVIYYEKINSYDVPNTNLPVNIRIWKDGLRHGESATFQIYRAEPKMGVILDEDGEPIKSKVNPQLDSIGVLHNAIGKPIPDEEKGWKDWSKVILTNKGTNGAAAEKTLMSLDPGYVYKVVEDAWGWAYELSQIQTGVVYTTSDVAVNPFKFHNEEKSNVPKHAEAVTINHFGITIQGGEFEGKHEEHYKSSKVETF